MKQKRKVDVKKIMSNKNLETRLKVIAKNVGTFVVFKICVDKFGNINILGVENEYDENDDEEDESPDEIDYPTIIPKIDIKKTLAYLEYIG